MRKSPILSILEYKDGKKHKDYKEGYLMALKAFDDFIAFVDRGDKGGSFVYDKVELKNITDIIREYIKEVKKII